MWRASGTGQTDVGVVRDHNEDAYLVDDGLQLYVVSDGMGGHKGGEIASAEAVRSVRQAIADSDGRVDMTETVETAIQAACSSVFHLAKTPQGKPGMGCTLTMLIVQHDRAIMGHVGDSRLYRMRNGDVEQISRDHSMVQRLLERGKITPEEARDHPLSHVLVNAVGLDADTEADVQALEIAAGDRFLICSDGLSNYFDADGELQPFLDREDAEVATAALVRHALDQGADDNVTVVLVDIAGTAAAGPVPGPDLLEHLLVVPGVQTRTCVAGEVLVSPGDAPGRWIVVKEGTLEVIRWGTVLRTLTAGHSAGSATLLEPRKTPYALRAVSDATVVTLDRATLDGLDAGPRGELLQLLALHLAARARSFGVHDL